MTATPHGPGRYAGTGAYMAQLDAAFKPRLADAAAEQQARQAATDMLERFETRRFSPPSSTRCSSVVPAAQTWRLRS